VSFVRNALLAVALAVPAQISVAQENTGRFDSFEAYDSFVNEKISAKDIEAFITGMGGADRVAEGQLAALGNQFRQNFPDDFVGNTSFKKELGGGFVREGRAFWTAEDKLMMFVVNYLERDGTIKVLTFEMGADPKQILNQF